MKIVVRNILAVVIGLIIGSLVNIGIISISHYIIPPPNDADVTTFEGLSETIHLFSPKHFIFPFLAHALGTLIGSILTAGIAKSYKIKLALIIGFFFLIGGIANAFMLPAPSWFIVTDLLLAYIPMSFIGAKVMTKKPTI